MDRDMRVSIKDLDGNFELKFDDKKIDFVSGYSVSALGLDLREISIKLVLPKENLSVEVDC